MTIWLIHKPQIPDDKFSVLLQYLEGLQGGARETTVQKALSLIEESGQAPEDRSVQQRAHRARDVVQLLSWDLQQHQRMKAQKLARFWVEVYWYLMEMRLFLDYLETGTKLPVNFFKHSFQFVAISWYNFVSVWIMWLHLCIQVCQADFRSTFFYFKHKNQAWPKLSFSQMSRFRFSKIMRGCWSVKAEECL